MAYTEAQLQEQITTLETALARGERSVTFADRSVTYRSTQELRDALSYFSGLLNQLQSRSRQSLGVASKGF